MLDFPAVKIVLIGVYLLYRYSRPLMLTCPFLIYPRQYQQSSRLLPYRNLNQQVHRWAPNHKLP
jgi:hypothetical protein